MNDPIETLMNEHRLIEKVLDSLERFTAAAGSEEGVDRKTVGEFAEFIREFADRCHHGKEEEILFTALEQGGMPPGMGPVAVMKQEHEIGRALVRRISAVAQGGDGILDEGETAELRAAAGDFIQLLRAHIQKEDQILFPMARNMLRPDAYSDVGARFEAFERDQMGDSHERLHRQAEQLVQRFQPAPSGR